MIKLWLIGFFLFFPARMSLADSIEALYQQVVAEELEYRKSLSLRERQEFRRTRWVERFQLGPERRRRYERWQQLREARYEFAEAVSLKQALKELHGQNPVAAPSIEREADQMAITIIKTFLEHKESWHMVQPPLLHNILINMGVSDKGLCYQWAEAFRGVLRPLGLRYFDIHWIVARQDELLEHNAISITARGGHWRQGLIVDGWRKAGRVFWRPLQGDEYPWQLVAREDEPQPNVSEKGSSDLVAE